MQVVVLSCLYCAFIFNKASGQKVDIFSPKDTSSSQSMNVTDSSGPPQSVLTSVGGASQSGGYPPEGVPY